MRSSRPTSRGTPFVPKATTSSPSPPPSRSSSLPRAFATPRAPPIRPEWSPPSSAAPSPTNAGRIKSATPRADGGVAKQAKDSKNGVTEFWRESWVLMVEGRSGHLRVMDKPPLDVCGQCEANIRVAYDGICQTTHRLRWERRLQKQVQVQVEAFKKMYLGKASFPESLERLQSEVDSLQETIDLLLSDGPVPRHLLPSVRLQTALQELEQERAQNALLENALQELQHMLQEEEAGLAQENRQLRQEVDYLHSMHQGPAFPQSPHTPRQNGWPAEGQLSKHHSNIAGLEEALQIEQSISTALRQQLCEMEKQQMQKGSPAATYNGRHDAGEREYLEGKLIALEHQLNVVIQERDELTARLRQHEAAQMDPNLVESPYTALKLESELVTLRGELLVEKQAHDTTRAQLDIEKERRNLMQQRMDDDARELAAMREDTITLSSELAKVQEQLRLKECSASSHGTITEPSAPKASDIFGNSESSHLRIVELEEALHLEKETSENWRQQAAEWERKAMSAQRSEKVLNEQLQALMDELTAKEALLTEAEAMIQVHRRTQQEQERELRRLRDEASVLRGRSGRSSPALSRLGSGRNTPVRRATSPPLSPCERRTSQTLAHSALLLAGGNTTAPSDAPLPPPNGTLSSDGHHQGSGRSLKGTSDSSVYSTAHQPATVSSRPRTQSVTSMTSTPEDSQGLERVSSADHTYHPGMATGPAPIVPTLRSLPNDDKAHRQSPVSVHSGRISDRTIDPGTPHEDDSLPPPHPLSGSAALDKMEAPQTELTFNISPELKVAIEKDGNVAGILWELQEAQRRHSLDPESMILTRNEADTILNAAQALRELVTSLPSWRDLPNGERERKPSLSHATRVVEAVTLFESIRHAAEGAADQYPSDTSHAMAEESPQLSAASPTWQAIADATLALYHLSEA